MLLYLLKTRFFICNSHKTRLQAKLHISRQHDIETFNFLMVSHHVADRKMHQHEPQKRLNHLLGTLFDLQLVRQSKYESVVMHICVPYACNQLRQLAYITLSTRGMKMPVNSLYELPHHEAYGYVLKYAFYNNYLFQYGFNKKHDYWSRRKGLPSYAYERSQTTLKITTTLLFTVNLSDINDKKFLFLPTAN